MIKNMQGHIFRQTESRTANSGFRKLAAQWLNEHLFFVSSVVLADSFVLRNAPLRQAAIRYPHIFIIVYKISYLNAIKTQIKKYFFNFAYK